MGFVKLPDDIKNWSWYDDNNTLCVYIRLLLAAEWRERDYRGVHLERGQVLTTVKEIATNNSLTNQQTKTILNRLKSTNRITIKSTPKYSIITVFPEGENFEINKQNNKQITNKQQTEQQTNNKQNNKRTLLYNIYTDNRYTDIQMDKNSPTPQNQNDVVESVENSETPKPPKAKQEKRKFAEFVTLTDDEYAELVQRVGESGAKRCIEILDNYKGANGKTYKSDYRAILNWVIDRYNSEPKSRQKENESSFDVDEVMRRIVEKNYSKGRGQS